MLSVGGRVESKGSSLRLCVVLYAHRGVREFEMHLYVTRWNVLITTATTLKYLVPGIYYLGTRYIRRILLFFCRAGWRRQPDPNPTTRTLTLWGDLCLDAVACERSRLCKKGDAVDGGCVVQNSRTRVCIYNFFGTSLVPWYLAKDEPLLVLTDEIIGTRLDVGG